MSQSLSRVILHIIFSTKYRLPLICESARPGLHAYIAGICREQKGEAFRVGGTEDHIHIAASLPRTITISKYLENIKKSSSVWIKTQDGINQDFSWQAGYAAYSLSEKELPSLLKYIDSQEEHHKKTEYRDEVLKFLKEYSLQYDEKYLWE